MEANDRRPLNGNSCLDESKMEVLGVAKHPGAPSSKCCVKCDSPRMAIALSCFLASLTFLGGINMNCLPYLPHPLTGNILPDRFTKYSEIPVVVFIILWGIHFVRRFSEVLFLQTFKRSYSIWKGLATVLYYTLFGLWIGWSLNFVLDDIHKIYKPPAFSLVGFGAIIFLLGEAGNCASHVALSRLRDPNSAYWTIATTDHKLPIGYLFRYISCPNYFFEVLTWLGFALATCTLASVMFFCVSFVILVACATRRHREYVREFNGKDNMPNYQGLRPNRKVIFPGIY